MALASAQPVAGQETRQGRRTAAVAWLVAAAFYFYQYVVRSAPSVMMPQLSAAFGLSALSVASIVSLFYYGYSPFSLVAGAGMDRLGPRRVIPLAAAVAGVGGLLFAIGNREAASIGRLLQGAGGVFAPVGAIYIATNKFPPSKAATLIGATQMFGMAGGVAGQFLVSKLINKGVGWDSFWLGMGIAGLAMGAILLFLLPKEEDVVEGKGDGLKSTAQAFSAVFKNPQSIWCGLIAGMLFVPTTIFGMIWGVRYLEEGHGLDYGAAVMRSSMVPLGWIIGCPLLGFISDRIGRRKPVIIGGALALLACLAWILFGRIGVFPPYSIGLVAGIASGAAMLPYSVIKEANPPEFGGTATGVITFLNFSLSAALAPIFTSIIQHTSGGTSQLQLGHYQVAFMPLLVGVAVAIGITLQLKETGPGPRTSPIKVRQEV